MTKRRYSPSEKWALRHGHAYARWMVVKYIILFVLVSALSVLAAIQSAALLQQLGASPKVAWIAALCLPLVVILFLYFSVIFPMSRDSRSLYKYASEMEETLRALGVKSAEQQKAEAPQMAEEPPIVSAPPPPVF